MRREIGGFELSFKAVSRPKSRLKVLFAIHTVHLQHAQQGKKMEREKEAVLPGSKDEKYVTLKT